MGSLLRMCAFVDVSCRRTYGRSGGGRTARRAFLFLQFCRPTVFCGKRLKLLEKISGFPPNLRAAPSNNMRRNSPGECEEHGPGESGGGRFRRDRSRRRVIRRSEGGADQVIAAFTAAAVIGICRRRAPTALKIALPMAGPTTVVAGSPRPTGASVLGTKLMSSSGTSARRSGV
ncbi:MAG: hypothetical protein RIR41_623 [Pseudomonadota bacterium]